jgi:hypothetical protein
LAVKNNAERTRRNAGLQIIHANKPFISREFAARLERRLSARKLAVF